MLKLALCDDGEAQRKTVGALLKAYGAARPELAVRVSVFSSGQELLAAAAENDGFDVYVLDVVMPGLSGIELGVQLRERGFNGAIIYLTVSPEYAVDSYAARAFYYLIKPVEPERLYQVLDQAVAGQEKQKAACFAVKIKDGLRLVRMDEILYVERSGRAAHFHLSGGQELDSMTVRGSFREEMAPLLADSRFFLCGASFIVNFFYVAEVGKGYFQMDDGKRISLPRGAAAQARQRWIDYWLDTPGRGRL